MSTEFNEETFWNRFKNPISPLAKALRAICSTPAEEVDVEFFEEFLLRYEENNLTRAEECTLSDIEILVENARNVQEENEQDEFLGDE